MSTHIWTVAQAKAKFSEVIDKAESDGPQTITRNGRTTAVIVAAKEWERKTKRKGTLADFFAASPQRHGRQPNSRSSSKKITRYTSRLQTPPRFLPQFGQLRQRHAPHPATGHAEHVGEIPQKTSPVRILA